VQPWYIVGNDENALEYEKLVSEAKTACLFYTSSAVESMPAVNRQLSTNLAIRFAMNAMSSNLNVTSFPCCE
jgi:hypothetical protein